MWCPSGGRRGYSFALIDALEDYILRLIKPSSLPLLLLAVAIVIVVLVFSIKFMKLWPRARELDRKYPGTLAIRSFVPFSRSWKANMDPKDIEFYLRVRNLVVLLLLILFSLRAAAYIWVYMRMGHFR